MKFVVTIQQKLNIESDSVKNLLDFLESDDVVPFVEMLSTDGNSVRSDDYVEIIDIKTSGGKTVKTRTQRRFG